MEIKAVKFRKDGFYTQPFVCGGVYDPAEHDGVAFEDLPDDWKCPRCRQGKEKFSRA